MEWLGFRSVFAKLFASVMLALILFAVAMVLLTQLVHDKDAGIRSEVLATQILGQIDPFLNELNVAISDNSRLQARFMLAVVKKSFDIFDESLQAKMGLYDDKGHLLMQTDNSDLPLTLPATPSLLTKIFPSFSDAPIIEQAQVYSSTGYTLLYESRLPPKKPVLSAALNLFTGTLLLLIIMAGVLWWIARTMTWRINQLSQQMVQLGDGDFTVRVNVRGDDEIASLGNGFNQAAQKIEHLINANNLLLAHASHELRTPITRIRLQIEMMDMLANVMPEITKAKFDKRAQAINRDLSGLNDLVESILLVSRLDAGHVMQQVERLDLYELVNQERQHYSEATLVGEHIVIDGQSAMLTHLIRNLLNNAILHGIPPVTILLYGIQTIEEADHIPDYLFQSVLDSSFAAYDHSNDADFDLTPIAIKPASQHSTNDPVELFKPPIYRNGETLIDNSDHNPITGMDSSYRQSVVAGFEVPFKTALFNSDTQIKGDHKLTTESVDRIRDAVWYAVPKLSFITKNDKLAASSTVDEKNTSKTYHVAGVGQEDNSGSSTVTGTIITPRKESLFKKHLKKSKAEPTRPDPKYVVLAVIDEGAGIPEDKREEIFSPFVRLQQKKKGSGLGLSLVSQIVAAHQGRIITDTINGHTRFLVIIPVKHDPHYNYKDHATLQSKQIRS